MTFLMSFCAMPMVAAKMAVAAPMTATMKSAVGAFLKMKEQRTTMYSPAVTIVAACMSAETGVGPAIASGSQTYKGICADLPHAPTKRPSAIHDMMPHVTGPVTVSM